MVLLSFSKAEKTEFNEFFRAAVDSNEIYCFFAWIFKLLVIRYYY